MHTSTRGGSSETDVNEFAVMPRGRPSGSVVVTTVTPVRNEPRADRNALRLCSTASSTFAMPPPQRACLLSDRHASVCCQSGQQLSADSAAVETAALGACGDEQLFCGGDPA